MCAHELQEDEEEEEEHSVVDLFAEEPPLALHEREWSAVDVGGPTSLLVELRQAEVWGSALLLSCWLMRRPETVRGRHVAELGAGVGLPSLTAALCDAASVVVTDYDREGVAAAARAAAHNCAVNPCVAALGRVRAERLDWKDACPPDGQVLGYAAPA
jgi:predicted nicotinamide N-methyase